MKQVIRSFLQAAALVVMALAMPAYAQFSPNTVLTASALNAALAAPAITGGSINGNTSITTTGAVNLAGTNVFGPSTTTTTPGYLDSSQTVATTAFTKQSILAAMATLPISVTASGTYNLASIGTGAIISITTSGGTVTSITGIVAPGSGYQVGDCLVLIGGNGDALIRINTLSGSGVATASILYGGSGYTGTPQLTTATLPPASRSGNLTGALTGNVTLIIPAGTYLAGARRAGFQNNTTGNFTVTVKLSNGAGGSTGTGVVLPQGTSNGTSLTLYTDGVNDIWPEVGAAPNFIVPGNFTLQGIAVKPNFSGVTGSLGGSVLAAGACSTTTVAITGAAIGMVAHASPSTYPGDGFYWRAYVTSSNTVTVGVCAVTNSSTPTASVYNVRVMQ